MVMPSYNARPDLAGIDSSRYRVRLSMRNMERGADLLFTRIPHCLVLEDESFLVDKAGVDLLKKAGVEYKARKVR